MTNPIKLEKSWARTMWLQAQGLNDRAPFGKGASAVVKAISRLGYIQIDTISVIERCHHHILFSRIPDYERKHLHQALTKDKTVFEYWTHALAYIPTKDYRYFMPDMKAWKDEPGSYFGAVTKEDMQKVIKLIKKSGPVAISDIKDDVLIEKTHAWGSKKPSKKALQWGFYNGELVISERQGMLKRYDLSSHHFAWDKKPKSATANEVLDYRIDRELQAQGMVSLESIAHLEQKKFKIDILKRIQQRVKKGALISAQVKDSSTSEFWVTPETLGHKLEKSAELTHILSPFDPLTIQRKRFNDFFGYDHRFEAYIPKEKRKYGYFGLPVVIGDQAVAVLDLKTDREKGKLLLQQWTWLPKSKSAERKKKIEEELHRFEKFQLAK